MNKYDIEISIMNRIKEPIETMISKAVDDINSTGYHFEESPSHIGKWVDKNKNMEIDVNSITSVSCNEILEETVVDNPEQLEIETQFYNLAEEGSDEGINILSSFEGEIANGGFEQLFLNMDTDSIDRALEVLKAIGADAKYQLAKEAISINQDYSQTIAKHTKFQNMLSDLDQRFDQTEENLPILYSKKYKL